MSDGIDRCRRNEGRVQPFEGVEISGFMNFF